jgi:hypothetical protein
MEISLEQDKKKTFNKLFGFVYDTTTIEYAYTKSNDSITKYYNRNNLWYDDGPSDEEECNGYSDCEFDDCELDDYKITKSEIHYKFKYEPKNFNEGLEDNDVDDCTLKILQNDPKDICLKCDKKIVIRNQRGFNYDHRGSDHTKIKLGFGTKIVLTPIDEKISFEKFIRACFDIKSHKFDFWYELYCGIHKVIEHDNSIEVFVNFDHGS